MGDRFLGIDFSGGAKPWRARVRQPTVWVATADQTEDRLTLVGLESVQELPGTGDGFARLVKLLSAGDYTAAAIDAPFSIPSAHIPSGGHAALLELVAGTPNGKDRPFPMGADLLALAERECRKASKKPLRACEAYWADRGVNTRSTLWNGPRGGAPFAAACLALIARSGRPCWPWRQAGPGLLVEAFPAAQLRQWGLPHAGYSGPEGANHRREIAAVLGERLVISEPHLTLMQSSPDALDAVIAIFGGVAACADRISVGQDIGQEGWIAVSP